MLDVVNILETVPFQLCPCPYIAGCIASFLTSRSCIILAVLALSALPRIGIHLGRVRQLTCESSKFAAVHHESFTRRLLSTLGMSLQDSFGLTLVRIGRPSTAAQHSPTINRPSPNLSWAWLRSTA